MALSARFWTLVRLLAVLVLLFAIVEAHRDGSRDGRPWWGDDDDYYGYDDDEDDGDDDDGDDDSTSGSGTTGSGQVFGVGFDIDTANKYRTAHGFVAAVAFLAMFPLGAIFVRTLPGRFALIMHVVAQIIALLLFIAAAGLGIWLLVNVKPFGNSLLEINDRRAHPILGIFIFALIFAMPVLGFLHHSKYKKYQRRTAVSHIHMWLGRVIVALGIINGGIGLHQVDASNDVKIGYAVIAGVVGAIWIFFSIFGEIKKKREQRRQAEEEERARTASAAAAMGVSGAAGPGGMTMLNRPLNVRSTSRASDTVSEISDGDYDRTRNAKEARDDISEISSRR